MRGGGKGPLLQIDKSAALTTVQTQTLFVPVGGEGKPVIENAIPVADKATRNKGGGDTRNNDGAGNGLGVGGPGAPSYTLTAADKHAVAYAIDRAAFNQGANAQYGISIEEEVAQTLVAKGPGAVAQPDTKTYAMQSFGEYKESEIASALKQRDFKDNTDLVVNRFIEYIVRRLTPLECCRLQGFPDYWTENLGTAEPTEDDILYWRMVFKEHMEALGEEKKEKTDNQIRKWIQEPDSDSAKYKMWGNGIALPCAMFVMEGIAEVLQRENEQEEQE